MIFSIPTGPIGRNVMTKSTTGPLLMGILAAGLAVSLTPAPASAKQVATSPAPSVAAAPLDPRIRYIAYGQNSIYRLDLYLKSVSVVQFSDSEEVESILIGDSASWEIVKLKNGHVVSIKATIPFAETNMTIYTDRRVYTFELHSRGDFSNSAGAPPPLRSVFTYPADKKPKQASGPAQPERIDSNYMLSGQAEFRPIWVQDNGRQTSFFLPPGSPRPAIFKVGQGNEEQLINSRTLGSRVVVDGTSDFWVLRIGDQSVCIARGHSVQANSRAKVERRPGGSHE